MPHHRCSPTPLAEPALVGFRRRSGEQRDGPFLSPFLRDDAIVDIDIVATLHATMPRMIISPPATDEEARYLVRLIVHLCLRASSQFHPPSTTERENLR